MVIRRSRRTDREVRADQVIREQEKMIRALTEELMNARRRTRDYIMERMGHCGDCAATEAWDEAADPYWLESLPPCDCAYNTVEGLFAEFEEQP